MSSRDFATELVESYIIDNKLKPGDRLPSERDMCRMWDLNRTTLRNAIQRLVSDGMLYCRMGSGTYVSKPKLERNLQAVIGFSEAAVEAGRVPSSKLVFSGVIEADKSTTRRLRVPLGTKVFELCRVRSIDGETVSVETTHLSVSRFPDLLDHDFSTESLFKIISEEYGVNIDSGEEKVSVTTLDDQEALLLGHPEGEPAFFQSGVIYDEEGVPIEYFKNVVLSQYVRFACELRS